LRAIEAILARCYGDSAFADVVPPPVQLDPERIETVVRALRETGYAESM
jgi:hypothetical protein